MPRVCLAAAVSLLVGCAWVRRDRSGDEGLAALRIDNASIDTVCAVELRSVSSRDSAPRRLASGDGLAPGRAQEHAVASGRYRVTLVDCAGNRVLDQPDVALHGAVELSIYSDYPPGHEPPPGYRRVAFPTLGVAGIADAAAVDVARGFKRGRRSR
ncbi:MAG: hypothetical protein B7733_25735 [Myxococcales bacterium FL481]|nr:MAG: hypothetical protein B7733_25735 [Myxococcales bacterium FL481]